MAAKSKTQEQRVQESQLKDFLASLSREDQILGRQTGNHRVAVALARDSFFLDQFRDTCAEVFADTVRPNLVRLRRDRVRTERLDNVLLTDLHFGSNLDPREVPVQYGPVEEARRFAYIAQEVLDYKPQYRAESSLAIHVAGDIIQNQLHDPRDGDILKEQFVRALYLFRQFVVYLATAPAQYQFRRIDVYGTPGNHGRNTARHHERATLQKHDSIENMVYEALKISCQGLKNVFFHIPWTPYYTYKAFNRFGFVTHGDTVLDFGHPQKSIAVESLVSQTNEINASQPHGQQYSLFAGGHVHSPSGLIHLPNGSDVIINGPLVPNDSFAVSKGKLRNRACGQTIWESVKNFIVGDYRYIRVDTGQDTNASLDRIIRPYSRGC